MDEITYREEWSGEILSIHYADLMKMDVENSDANIEEIGMPKQTNNNGENKKRIGTTSPKNDTKKSKKNEEDDVQKIKVTGNKNKFFNDHINIS